MLTLILLACDNSTAEATSTDSTDPACIVVGDRPAGWGEATHANSADPDYDVVFDHSSVLRVDLTISAQDHDAMYEELAVLLGAEFGEGEGGAPPDGEGDPREAMDACRELDEGDACTLAVDGTDTSGTCEAAGPQGELLCTVEASTPGGGADLAFASSDPSYVEATVTVEGTTWCGVGMRYKGNSTLSQAWSAGSEKLPFRLDFDRFEDTYAELDDQRFYGFSDLTFGNNMTDDTYIRDVMASIILEDRGVPAARNRFAAVYLDAGEGAVYLGLYTLGEDPSDALADRIWGDNDGDLYEADGSCADLTCYDAESFEPQTNDEADGSQVDTLVAALSADRTDALAWRQTLGEALDTDGFLRWLAVNSAMENWDTYGSMGHNYYLYAPPGDGGRLSWIPWDHNMALADGMMGSTDPLLADVGEEWPLIHHMLDDEVFAATYQGYLAVALEGEYAEDRFQTTAERYRALIAPYVIGDTGERAESGFIGDEATWDAGYDALYEHAADRRAEVLEAIQ